MTMTAQAAFPSPPDPAEYHDPHHPKYGFHTEKWHDSPRPSPGQEWFSAEERFRREANAHAYRQHGTPSNWFRYITLGYFVYDDCCKFEALWMKYSDDPIICHRMVLYNFFYHIDRNFDIPDTLHAWAMDVSQPYLQRHAPQYLAINTLDQTWNDHIHGDHDVLDIDRNQWMTVGASRKKHSTDTLVQTRTQETRTANQAHPHQSFNNQHSAPSFGSTSNIGHQAHDETSAAGKQSVLQPDLNVPVNDGTYRLTFRWHPKGDFALYNEHSTLWLKEVHAMMQDIFSDEDCFFYRWESTDLQMSTTISKLSPGELREFLSPTITFLPSTSQIIFGARICFAAKFPGQWRNSDTTVEGLGKHKVQIHLSNSSTSSGKIVTAGYLLFKAARTTHRTRFLQSLRQRLPKETPFFDIVLYHRTPTEQKINHLVIQCGENHVSPLSQALSELLTGHNSPLYLSRLALANLTTAQISAYFDMQDLYAKSLKSLPLFPTLINLDKSRKEVFDDGTIVERSTREWATTIFQDQADQRARCEVVNGGLDQKAYLLVPAPYVSKAAEHLRLYRLRVNPISRRETRFRDSLPGLPAVIQIDTSTQQNLDLLESMSSKEVWLRAPASVRGMPVADAKTEMSRSKSGATKNDTPSTHNQSSGRRGIGSSRQKQLSSSNATESAPGDDFDDQTAFTQSATQSVATPSMMSSATSRRLNELEALFRRQQQETSENAALSTQNANSLIQIEAKLGRLDDMDNLLQDNREKLALTMERQQDSHVQIVELNIRVSKLMDVIDRMATKIESITSTMITDNKTEHEKRHTENPPDSTRRRTLEEMKDAPSSSTPFEDSKPRAILSQVRNMRTPEETKHHQQSTKAAQYSPSKKKSRPLHDDMEDMSLGSNASSDTSTATEIPPNRSIHDMSLPDSSLLDESNDFSYQTPDPDTQYNNHSDSEGGVPK